MTPLGEDVTGPGTTRIAALSEGSVHWDYQGLYTRSSIRGQVSQSIVDRLKQGQRDGDVPKTAPIAALAAYYSTVLYGLALQSRDGASESALTKVVKVAMANWQQCS